MGGWWPSKVSVKGLSYRLTFLIDSKKKIVAIFFGYFKLVKFTHQKWGVKEHASLAALSVQLQVGNVKLLNNHSGLRGLPCFAEGIYWATGLSLATPFTEGCPGVNNKASPPGRRQEQAPKQRCTFSSTTFSS